MLSIIIVNWNVCDLLAKCLDSLGTQHEIIVIDSASTDGSVALMRDRYPHVRLLVQTENIGFSKGNNLGLAAASGDYLMLLNPDTEIIGDALDRMVAYLDAHPDVGIVGPHTLNTDGSHQSTRRRFPSLITGFFESTWFESFAPRTLLDRYTVRDVPDDAIADVDWVQGSALMARRAVYAQIGGLDERFIMYSEEMDWCRRARNAGWRVVYLGDARITHHGGKSSEQVTARKHILFQQSKLYYFNKHHGALAAFALRLVLIANYLVQITLEGGKALLKHKADMRRQRIEVYWQVLRSLCVSG
jgi:GT2 family glycosyltransferase